MLNVLILFLLALLPYCHSRTQARRYFVAAVDIEWDYAPTGTNVITNETIHEHSIEAKYLIGGNNRIGRKYGKAVFIQYTDETFTEEIPKEEWQGLLGPILYGEVGDTIEVIFKNLASRPYSIHAHGVLYDKASEGARYEDKTSAKQRVDDSVVPGANHTYKWRVDEISGPADGDPNCIAWPYHSHVITSSGTNTGLVGTCIICRKGILNEEGRRTDVNKDFVLLVTVTDENLSYYIDDNIHKYCTDPGSVDPDDEDFQESNKMHSINGYVYGNLPGLDMCQGDRVAWHVFGLGTETDLHTLLFHGNILNIRNHRRDSFSISPAIFVTGEMKTFNPGKWLLRSEVNTHYQAGSLALYNVDPNCANQVTNPDFSPTKRREYFIQAEEYIWDYAPSGEDRYHGISLTDPESPSYPFFINDTNRIGGRYKKVGYVGYTDATFSTRKARGTEEDHLGFLGPVIRVEVGDEIAVTFRNNASRAYNIFAHGVMYNKANEGFGYADRTTGSDKMDDAVSPGETHRYRWTVPDHYAPTREDEDCITWLYYSAVDPVKDVYSGLVGPLLVCRSGTLNDDGKREDVQEFHLFLMKVDENRSWYIDDNIIMFTSLSPDDAMDDDEFMESNLMEGINGYSFANLPGLNNIHPDQTVSWHVSTLGGDTDQHTIHFRGHTVTHNGQHVDTISLTPGVSATALMKPLRTGTWGIECMTNSHYVNGMTAMYTVNATYNDVTEEMAPKPDIVRTFHIAATEIEWDFAPNSFDFIKNVSLLNEESPGNVFVKHEGPFLGSVYKKAVFRQYEDETFTTEVIPEQSQQHLGILGPIIHAEVGDQIKIIFKNMASRDYSIYLHGLMYSKDALDAKQEHRVNPDGIQPYTWNVPEEAGPGDGDQDCVLYAYYSDVDRVRDTHSGLIGPLVICKQGTLGIDSMRWDVNREFVLLFNVFDENQSWYLDDNIKRYAIEPEEVDVTDGEFEESNLMHGINGYLFGNLKNLEMYVDETVEWYLISVGEEVDIHTVHFHGQSVLYQQFSKHRVDVVEMFPGLFSSVQMKLKEPGHWLLHCHVNDHLLGGMVTTYEVKENAIHDSNSERAVTLSPEPTAGQMSFMAYTPFVLASSLLSRVYHWLI
ncbi:LOW QUALITY PROTEIN: hephaestin-like protein [Amphiura filiformis]|uniref:LOW QUALITY PROTEIN: hephaestin-like protein n=1 Tax=Amphiura filiformis TaxID=82378 RepID=UPI003B21D3DC